MIFEIPKDTEVLQIDITEVKKQIRAEAIDKCIKTIVNTPTKIKIEHYRENDILVDRQNEIIDMLIQLKEQK